MILLFPTAGGSKKTDAVRCARGAEGPQASAGKTVAALRTRSPEPTRYRPTAVCARNKNKHCRTTKHSAPTFVWLAGFSGKRVLLLFHGTENCCNPRIPAPVMFQKAGGIISSPAVSAKPNIRFMFCTACPAAPFTILSSTDTICSIRPL